jgi:hypothetical protein
MVYIDVFQYIWTSFNVFNDTIIEISPSHSHFNVFAIRTYQYICFSISIITLFPTCFMWATKFTLGVQKGLMVKNMEIGMVKIGYK